MCAPHTGGLASDVLVIGSGIAGLSAALGAARRGASVTIATKASHPEGASTWWAQGGIAVARRAPEDFGRDIVAASDNTADEAAIDVLVSEADAAVQDVLIETLDVPFDTEEKGQDFHYGREAAHSDDRILHVDASTGRHIHAPFLKHLAQHDQVTILEDTAAIRLLHDDSSVRGAILVSDEMAQPHVAGATILATGGIGALYSQSTNPDGATGDGIAMAMRAGAATDDLEYVQFHPTVCVAGERPFLLSEAIRGEGAVLRDANGERFMPDVHPDAELAPRDVVARAVQQARASTGRVILDVSPLDFAQVFPDLAELCAEHNIDPDEGIPVAPAEHFLCGGIDVDTWGRSSLEQLYAVGECAGTGVHGANRLASTSLLEGLVWGLRAGADAAREASRPTPPSDTDPVRLPSSQEGLAPLFRRLQHVMDAHLGLVRTPAGLQKAVDQLEKLGRRVESLMEDTPSRALYELRSACTVAQGIARAAASNSTSAGCHYVSDDREATAAPTL